jgi:hypothetical protein
MRAQGWEPWIFAIETQDRMSATLALIKQGKLSAELELPSLPEIASQGRFWEVVHQLCRRRNITDLVASTFASSPFTLPPLTGEISRQTRQEFVVDLAHVEMAQILSSNHKRNIKKAQTAGVQIRRTRDRYEWLSDHVRLINQSVQRRLARGEAVPTAADEKPFQALLENGAAELFQAVSGETVLSSVLVLLSSNTAYYQSAGSSPEGMNIGASHFLITGIARVLKTEGREWFNLGGAPEGSSLARFKQGFGAEVVVLPSATCYVGAIWKRKLRSVVHLIRSDRSTLLRSLTGSSLRLLVYGIETTSIPDDIVPPVPEMQVHFLDESSLRTLEPPADDPSFRTIQLERLQRCGTSYAYGVYCGKKIVHIAWLMPATVVNAEVPRVLALREDEAEITGCETVSEFRGKGVYPFAIRSLTRIAKQQGIRQVFMKTQETNLASQHGIAKAGLRRCGSVSLINPPLFPSRTIIRRNSKVLCR